MFRSAIRLKEKVILPQYSQILSELNKGCLNCYNKAPLTIQSCKLHEGLQNNRKGGNGRNSENNKRYDLINFI